MKIRNLKFVFLLGIGVFAGEIVSCSGNNEVNNVETNDSMNHLLTKEAKIAYVMIDSITEKYELWKEVNEMLQKERENAENQITQKGKSFENQLPVFQTCGGCMQFFCHFVCGIRFVRFCRVFLKWSR